MISSPEKGRNNTGKKICVSDADTAPAFRVTRSGWWMNGKTFTILNLTSLNGIVLHYGC